eukprot:TRINITY_DN222_c2_g1_i1.p1 TRINITY_DN222_c2_g1~~TRINITY_DN222_c2_g1_i1.p1  ORF type:complete len:223 (+),score=-26.43 TRINITY_DN222_c2_g1_i1:33-701(+)
MQQNIIIIIITVQNILCIVSNIYFYIQLVIVHIVALCVHLNGKVAWLALNKSLHAMEILGGVLLITKYCTLQYIFIFIWIFVHMKSHQKYTLPKQNFLICGILQSIKYWWNFTKYQILLYIFCITLIIEIYFRNCFFFVGIKFRALQNFVIFGRQLEILLQKQWQFLRTKFYICKIMYIYNFFIIKQFCMDYNPCQLSKSYLQVIYLFLLDTFLKINVIFYF